MAKISISTLKTAFETGDRPNGADYVNLIDTLAANSTDLGSSGNNEQTINGIENATVVDTFLATEWRMIKYFISFSKTTGGANKYFATELSILIDGTDINVTQYGLINNDGDMGTIQLSKAGNTVSLTVTPDVAVKPITVRFARMGLKA
jgi:hypothetical protein